MNITEAVYYDETSKTFLRWKLNVSTRLSAGDVAGHVSNVHGYGKVSFRGCTYQIHDVVWNLLVGEIPQGSRVDHKNLIRSDNRLMNLRLCSHSQNMMNTKVRTDSSSGIKGVFWYGRTNQWHATITVNGKRYIKRSKSQSVVEDWLLQKRVELHGDFCNHG